VYNRATPIMNMFEGKQIMPYSRYVDADGVLITKLSGVVTLKELIELENELHSYVRDEEIYELVVHPDDVDMVLNNNESIISADNVKGALMGLRRGAIAFVSNSSYVFGLCRQLEMRAENEFIQLRVFRSEETALKWLRFLHIDR